MKRILNIHGLMWSGNKKWDNLFTNLGHFAITIDMREWEPKEVFSYVSNFIEKDSFDLVVGRSLGGFYAYHLNIKYGIPTLLFNPSLMAHENLIEKKSESFIQQLQVIHDNGMEQLKNQTHHPKENSHLFIGMKDRVVKPAHALSQFEGGNIHKYDHIGHRFSSHLSHLIPEIESIMDKI